MAKRRTVAERRRYGVLDVKAAKEVSSVWLEQVQLQKVIDFGLPEVDDRYHIAVVRDRARSWLGQEAKHVLTINRLPVDATDMLF